MMVLHVKMTLSTKFGSGECAVGASSVLCVHVGL